MNSPFSLLGKKILITGASSGIGRYCALACYDLGAELILLDRNEEGLLEIKKVITSAECYGVDLTDWESVEHCTQKIIASGKKIDGMVNCVGISATLPLRFLLPEDMEKFFKINVIGAFNLLRAIGKGNISSGGSIVFLASVMSVVGEVGKTIYGMTKGAILSGTRSLALELAQKKIRVNAVSPGVVVTPINEKLPHIADPEKRKLTEERHPLGLGEPEDVANVCLFLLSDASRWITGQNIIVDGGYTIK